jgi:hypothetical protein
MQAPEEIPSFLDTPLMASQQKPSDEHELSDSSGMSTIEEEKPFSRCDLLAQFIIQFFFILLAVSLSGACIYSWLD